MLCNYDVLSASNKTGRLNAFNVLKQQTISNGNKKQNVEIHVNENIHVHQFKKQKSDSLKCFGSWHMLIIIGTIVTTTEPAFTHQYVNEFIN